MMNTVDSPEVQGRSRYLNHDLYSLNWKGVYTVLSLRFDKSIPLDSL